MVTLSDPLPAGSVISVWGDPRPNGRTHKGIDIADTYGTPIVAAADGTIVRQSQLTLCGLRVAVAHADNVETISCHMSAYARRLGDRVSRGDIVGYVGQSGNAASTTPHVHFEVSIGPGYNPVDPQGFIRRGRGNAVSDIGSQFDPILDDEGNPIGPGDLFLRPAVSGLIPGLDAAQTAVAVLTNPQTWIRVLQVVAGAGLVTFGLVVLVKDLGAAEIARTVRGGSTG